MSPHLDPVQMLVLSHTAVPTMGMVQTSGIGPGDGAGVEVAPATSQPGSPNPANNQPTGNPLWFMWILLPMLLVMMLLSGGGQRKERKQRQQLLNSLGKHDLVQTSGGIIGTISEIRDNEVLLKIDEASPSRVRFAKASIQHVIRSHAQKSEAAQDTEVAAAS